MMVNDPKYQNHVVFKELEGYIVFYKRLSLSIHHWLTMGTRAIGCIDSYVFSSIQGTLDSIRTLLTNGRINDAYALLRKYYDSVIINIYSNLYLQDNFSLKNFVVEQIDNWLKGKAKLPEFRIMSQYIRESTKTAPITDLLFRDDHYKSLRNRCNDHTHYNFYRNVLLNDNEIVIPDRLQALDQISVDIRDILILHVAYIFFINDHYMMSRDHCDYLECGMTPEPDSEYWVAGFVQEIFNEIVTKNRPDITAVVKQHTSMHLA